MEAIFTPNEAAALAYLPIKRVYKEIEYNIIQPIQPLSNKPRLSFAGLIYLRALKEINFEFSVQYRASLSEKIVKATEEKELTVEFAKFFILQLNSISQELSELISQFNEWKSCLVNDTNIMGGQTVFPNSRLSVYHLGKIIARGESLEAIREDYPYLLEIDLKFAPLYVKAYPVMGRPKQD
ncbi:conserved hypothetical protein [Hyella patelloides LEGE 07179]|uniref:DUF433 domain-containing protein n=1 Tax=Hyella patelloides LEGE 07179 TaxID=945734 RepID=A0A563W2U5_9CYAN|nr:DUF433 domain-containing protein [Hyella patelloides]VEP17965.1 conserved hypothetical protein [Hyella patelloides LEGE 07179]